MPDIYDEMFSRQVRSVDEAEFLAEEFDWTLVEVHELEDDMGVMAHYWKEPKQ